jgi:gliding motility-associated-like protein
MSEWPVTLTVFSPMGCFKSKSIILYPEGEVYIPNTFTPNNDGLNDVFLAEGHDLKRFELSIFNRWGERLFYTNDITTPWDGSDKGGAYYSQDGIYNYKLIAEGIRGNLIEKSGVVRIIR